MTSISGATLSPVVWDRSKTLALPEDFATSEPADSAYSRWRQAEADGVPLIPDNRPDNVWGKITLPSGEVVTIYNKGGTESENPLDIDWNIDGEAARAEAIMAKYGGTLEIADTADPDAPKPGSDVAALLSNILDNPVLSERMLGAAQYQLVPDELATESSVN